MSLSNGLSINVLLIGDSVILLCWQREDGGITVMMPAHSSILCAACEHTWVVNKDFCLPLIT